MIEDVSAIRKNGYGFDLQEHEVGIHCVAAPARTRAQFYAAISVTGPAYRVDLKQLRKWGRWCVKRLIKSRRNLPADYPRLRMVEENLRPKRWQRAGLRRLNLIFDYSELSFQLLFA